MVFEMNGETVKDPWRHLIAGGRLPQRDAPASSRGTVRNVHQPSPDIYATDETGMICLRGECEMVDIDCLLNRTKSIQYQHVALPTIDYLQQPIVLVTVHMVGYTIYPRLGFQIERGNEEGHFDVIQNNVGDDKGSLRLLKPIYGEGVYQVWLRMDNRNRYGSVITSHYAIIKIFVSKHSF